MEKPDYPVTPAVRLLREKKVDFAARLYAYEDHGGTTRAAAELSVPEHAVIKTLVMETEQKKPLMVLMHGDREVSTKQLARALGVKIISPCDAATAQRHTGYVVGGISPFGTRAKLPVYVERTILALPEIYINGGKRGFLIAINPHDLRSLLAVTEVDVAIARELN
ncbi:MAG: Cys-tRNA(Pro) deacylase [Acidobacteriota bacterium]|nr:Cys-tRNA(Pro) deacylase [Acidobacteriota bacterium]